MLKDLAIKTGVDVGATLTFTSMLADIGKQFIMASIVVFVNILLYPLLKSMLKALSRKFKLDLTDEDIDEASKQITDKVKQETETKEKDK